MNENRVLLFTCIGLITILATLLLPDVGYLQAVRFKSDGENESAKCGAVARGLKLCTRSSEFEIIPGEPFSLTLWLVNISDHEIKVRANRDWSNFEIEILDSNGKSIPSKIVKRSQEGSLSYEEQKEFVNSIRRDNRSKLLAPNETLMEEIPITDLYELRCPGDYIVEIRRRTLNPNKEGINEFPLIKVNLVIK